MKWFKVTCDGPHCHHSLEMQATGDVPTWPRTAHWFTLTHDEHTSHFCALGCVADWAAERSISPRIAVVKEPA